VVGFGVVAEREADGEGLVVVRTGFVGGVELAGLGAGLGAGDELGSGHRQQLAGFGGVEEIRGAEDAFVACAVAKGDGADAVAVDVGPDGAGLGEQGELSGGEIRLQHRVEHGERDARLVGERRHRAAAGVEPRVGARRGQERVVVAVVLADALAEGAPGSGAAEHFDPGMFVRRHRLRGELAADPAGLLGHDHAQAGAAGGQRGGATARAAAHDGDIAGDLPAGGPGREGKNGNGRNCFEKRAPCQLHPNHSYAIMGLSRHGGNHSWR